jgi:hypothetical protein
MRRSTTALSECGYIAALAPVFGSFALVSAIFLILKLSRPYTRGAPLAPFIASPP